MTRHAILAYGRETEHRRAILAVLSFWARYSGEADGVRTVVFTDQPALFAASLADLPVDYVQLTPEQLEAMYGPQHYIHRVKVVLLEQLFRDHPADQVLFCDSDTFFMTDPAELLRRLQPGVSLMHRREYSFDQTFPKWESPNDKPRIQAGIDQIVSQPFQPGTTEYRFQETQFVWNSGVLGLTAEAGPLLPDVFALMDRLYATSAWRISEQVAFSLVLAAHTQLKPSAQAVYHYWSQPLKDVMDELLLELLTARFEALPPAERLAQIRQLTGQLQRNLLVRNARRVITEARASGNTAARLKGTVKLVLASVATRYLLRRYSGF